jgi:hypothetical protein
MTDDWTYDEWKDDCHTSTGWPGEKVQSRETDGFGNVTAWVLREGRLLRVPG